MPRLLPYPGHTWSFTQHAVGLNPKTLYDFLKCAAPFEGEVDGYDEKITSLMVASGVLTPNERNGSLDAWRDYQQLLAELGLIVSTKICRVLTITELGQMYLAGEVGFSELLGIQALRYQYPNGQKSTIQNRLAGELAAASIAQPSTLTELQLSRDVLIKPGLLILRILIELFEAGHNPALSVSECQAFLLPCKQNSAWPAALSEVISQKVSPQQINHVNRHARRNIQDWFKFLLKSDFFSEDVLGNICLSAQVLERLDFFKNYCFSQEDPATFWVPGQFDIQSRLSWFTWFGQLPYSVQGLLKSSLIPGEDYVRDNFVAGLADEIDDDVGKAIDRPNLNLRSLDLEQLGRDTTFTFNSNIEILAENLRLGAQKRHAKTLLHDKIIKYLAEAFIAQGAIVESDPDSIDLLSTWPNGNSAIFEVKTVTRRSLQNRLRTAVGQVEEYAYRRRIAGGPVSDRVVVINAEIEESAWQRSFLTEHLKVGLICKQADSYLAYAPTASLTQNHWLNLV